MLWRSAFPRSGSTFASLEAIPDYIDGITWLRKCEPSRALIHLERVRDIAANYMPQSAEHYHALNLLGVAHFHLHDTSTALSLLIEGKARRSVIHELAFAAGWWQHTRPEWAQFVLDGVPFDEFHGKITSSPEELLKERSVLIKDGSFMEATRAVTVGSELSKKTSLSDRVPDLKELLEEHIKNVEGNIKMRGLGALSRLYFIEGDAVVAEGLARTAVKSLEQSVPREKLWLAECLENYALLLDHWDKRASEAATLKERAVQAVHAAYPPAPARSGLNGASALRHAEPSKLDEEARKRWGACCVPGPRLDVDDVLTWT